MASAAWGHEETPDERPGVLFDFETPSPVIYTGTATASESTTSTDGDPGAVFVRSMP